MGEGGITNQTPTLSDYTATRSVSTRWADADVFGHINTSVYIQLFDAAINGWLVQEPITNLTMREPSASSRTAVNTASVNA